MDRSRGPIYEKRLLPHCPPVVQPADGFVGHVVG
jgi:hypothetical protein